MICFIRQNPGTFIYNINNSGFQAHCVVNYSVSHLAMFKEWTYQKTFLFVLVFYDVVICDVCVMVYSNILKLLVLMFGKVFETVCDQYDRPSILPLN